MTKFIDYTKIVISSGAGGNGAIAFRREKYVPAGGPAGGDGGKGGDVIFRANKKLKTLYDLKYKKYFKAQNGENGKAKNCNGKDGEDLIIDVPVGTIIKDNEGNVLADLVKDGQEYIALYGGKGGRGNAHFANSRNKAPKFAEPGGPASQKEVILELKLLADVGLIGLPNAGKSTLLSVISNAKPKIADYEFTTLEPNLGVVNFEDREGFVVADIPGLIEGAHKGIGLGHEFLRHIERTKLLVHLIDITKADPLTNYKTIRNELELYSSKLTKKPEIVVFTKIDLCNSDYIAECENIFIKEGIEVLAISSVTNRNIDKLISKIESKLKLQEVLEENIEQTINIIQKYDSYKTDYSINKLKSNVYEIKSEYLERIVSLTNLEDMNALNRFQKIVDRMGINNALKNWGANDGDTVKIGNFEFTYLDK